MTPLFRPSSACEEEMKLPAERSLDLMHSDFRSTKLGRRSYKPAISPGAYSDQVLTQFANLISISVPENLKLLSYSFNLLEMGYSRQEVARLIAKERRRPILEPVDVDVKPKRSRPASVVEPNVETTPSQDNNGNQSDDE
ncbi:hypothetical protein COOONC_23555, partial [Cooperia oncophora]